MSSLPGNIYSNPAEAYWAELDELGVPGQVDDLQKKMDAREGEFTTGALPTPESAAKILLERVAADGWLKKTERHSCPVCEEELDNEAAEAVQCPECEAVFAREGGVVTEAVYERTLSLGRSVDWVIAIHGMNTTGAWQETFSWLLATTWGKSVPVFVYKYGNVVVGVVLSWRRNKLLRNFRSKLATLHEQANAAGYRGKPDIVAHSFGTWLLGWTLKNELKKAPADQLKFGRIILTGCVIRPDFDWNEIITAGLADDVLNHYGTNDNVVPIAHMAIVGSGPSGRRGFDQGSGAFNLKAEGFGHSSYFTENKLPGVYRESWKPFLTLPADEYPSALERSDPKSLWKPYPRLLQGRLFPFIAVPLLLSLVILLGIFLGGALLAIQPLLLSLAGICGGLLGIYLVLVAALSWINR